MKAIKLALTLLRIPRLFLALFCLPLLLGIVIVCAQTLASALFLTYHSNNQTERRKETLSRERPQSWVRNTLLGVSIIPANARICYWRTQGSDLILPEDPTCKLERYDVVIQPQVLDRFPLSNYQKLLDGYFTTIHICDGCVTDIVIWEDPQSSIRVDFRSFFGLSLFAAVDLTTEIRASYIKAAEAEELLEATTGERYLVLDGFGQPALLDNLTTTFVIIINVCLLIITALWLALKAHRRILDYFSHSGALLPLVAASGPKTFYSSLWLLTSLRVMAFIGAAVPFSFLTFANIMEEKIRNFLFPNNTVGLILWLACLIVGLALATLVASISELKYHHTLTNLRYKLIPMLACCVGGLIWGLTFLIEVDYSDNVRTLLTLIPLVSISPVVMAPIFPPNPIVMGLNFVFTLSILLSAGRKNSAWFAAHLDEI